MITDFTQRWREGGKPIYQPLREYFNPRDFEIAAIDEQTAKQFILKYHYSKSFPASRRRFGLFEKGKLVGAAVYSHPMAEKVITNVFGCEKASDGLELGRLVLTQEILSNAESFFVAACHRQLKAEGFVGVVSFSDDVPRVSLSGEKAFSGHLGIVYQASNAAFLNRSTPMKLYLLPDGTSLSRRTISKIRSGDIGWNYGAKILQSFGADECPSEDDGRRNWLTFWLNKLTRRLNHPGNLRYGWSFSRKVILKGQDYPKIRYGDVQRQLAFH